MTAFNPNKNVLSSTVNAIKNETHSFASLGVAKGSRLPRHYKKALMAKIEDAVEGIDTDDFGIRIFIMKTKE